MFFLENSVCANICVFFDLFFFAYMYHRICPSRLSRVRRDTGVGCPCSGLAGQRQCRCESAEFYSTNLRDEVWRCLYSSALLFVRSATYR